MTLHPVWAAFGFAGLCVTIAASFLGVYAILLRDRWAEPLWFAATLGAAMLVAAALAHPGQPLGAYFPAEYLLVVVESIAMWVIAHRWARATGPGSEQPLPRWQAAAWAMNLPYAAQLGWLVLMPLAWLLHSAASAPWLVDQCMAMSEVDLRKSGLWVCDVGRTVTSWWWMFGMIGSAVATGIMLVWLVFLVAPRGARLRLAGFIVLVWIASHVATPAWELGGDIPGETIGYLFVAFAVSIAAGWAAFRPLRTMPSPAPTAPAAAPKPGSRGWRWRWVLPAGLFAACLLLGGSVLAYVSVLQSNLRDTAPYLDAVARARTHPVVIGKLGEPVNPGRAVAGVIRDDMPGVEGRAAALTIPLHGPRGHAKLQVQAMTIDGAWRFIELALETEDAREPLDLFDVRERAAEDARREAMRAKRARDPAPRVCPEDEFDDVFNGA